MQIFQTKKRFETVVLPWTMLRMLIILNGYGQKKIIIISINDKYWIQVRIMNKNAH